MKYSGSYYLLLPKVNYDYFSNYPTCPKCHAWVHHNCVGTNDAGIDIYKCTKDSCGAWSQA